MKKWYIIYLFLAGFLSHSIYVQANSFTKDETVTVRESAICKAASLSAEKWMGHEKEQAFETQSGIRSVFSFSSFFILSAQNSIISLRGQLVKLVTLINAEQAVKNYLLHLYPSHYFW